MFNIILLGDPASGKATQAAHLVKKYGLFDFDMGEELRKLKFGKNKAVRTALARTMDKGNLTPTAIVRSIYKKKIPAIPGSQGILFDGHPKMLGEAKLVNSMLQKSARKNAPVYVIYVRIPKAEVVARMSKRARPDDSLKALQNRIKYYNVNISQVVRFFKSKYRLIYIDGMGSRKVVLKRLEHAIKQFMDKNKRRD